MIMNLSQGVNLVFRSNNFHLLESIQPGHNSLDNSQPGHKATAEMQKVADAADISVLFFSAGANFWAISAILGHFWAILGHFWAIFWC